MVNIFWVGLRGQNLYMVQEVGPEFFSIESVTRSVPEMTESGDARITDRRPLKTKSWSRLVTIGQMGLKNESQLVVRLVT